MLATGWNRHLLCGFQFYKVFRFCRRLSEFVLYKEKIKLCNMCSDCVKVFAVIKMKNEGIAWFVCLIIQKMDLGWWDITLFTFCSKMLHLQVLHFPAFPALTQLSWLYTFLYVTLNTPQSRRSKSLTESVGDLCVLVSPFCSCPECKRQRCFSIYLQTDKASASTDLLF